VGNGDDASAWTLAVHHLVQAHGGDRDLILSRTPTLEQVFFARFDTHVALQMAGLLPPDGHVHPEPLPPGWPEGPAAGNSGSPGSRRLRTLTAAGGELA
jgi:hypothetical protein